MSTKHRVAFQLFGQLRMWEEQIYLLPLIDAFKENDCEVDVFGTFWDEPYSREMVDKDKMGIFNRLDLIPLPEDYLQGLWRWGYSLLKSRNHRLKYQLQNNIEYDLVVALRPDLYIGNPNTKAIGELLKAYSAKKYIYKVWFQKVISNSSIKPFDVDDKSFIGTEEAMNLFCLGFNHVHSNPDSIFHSAYHTDPIAYVKMFSLLVEPYNIVAPIAAMDLMRHQHLKKLGFTTEPHYDTALKSVKTMDDIRKIVDTYRQHE